MMKLTGLICIFLISLTSVLATSCATMFNGGTQSITAASTTGAEVPVTIKTPSGSYRSKLPATIVAKPSTFQDVMITVDDVCYDPSATVVSKQITPSFWANIFNGGWGFLVDPFTGSMWIYDSQVSVPVNQKANCLAH
ncbi:MAG: hypothetical protein EOP04_18020 [Proteobacteria bacterium]|nr:MAG: hypothetical protein EOP04_18020 [Pseudomonadota bacterium]